MLYHYQMILSSPPGDRPRRDPLHRSIGPSAAWLDATGITVSVACAIHCAAESLVLAALAILGVTRAMPSWLEWAFLMTSLLIGSIALRRGFRSHRQSTPLRLFGMGIGTLLLARVTDATSPWEIIVVVLGATFLIAAHALNWRHARSCRQCASTPVDVRPASCGVR
jgi:hypothetical protein